MTQALRLDRMIFLGLIAHRLTQEMEGEMGDYAFRVTNALLGSELLPAFMRTKLMRLVGFKMSKEANIWAGGNFRSTKVTISPGVFINIGFYHDGYDELYIGRNVRIGPYVRIITATHEIGPPHQRGLIEVLGKPVRIEDGCWVGVGVTILPGVTVEKGCVLAAGAIVRESTEPDGLYAGNPARRVRDLDPADAPSAFLEYAHSNSMSHEQTWR